MSYAYAFGARWWGDDVRPAPVPPVRGSGAVLLRGVRCTVGEGPGREDAAVQIDREEPGEDGTGWVRCRVCGLQWATTPDQDALLADLFAHDDTHGTTAPHGPAPD